MEVDGPVAVVPAEAFQTRMDAVFGALGGSSGLSQGWNVSQASVYSLGMRHVNMLWRASLIWWKILFSSWVSRVRRSFLLWFAERGGHEIPAIIYACLIVTSRFCLSAGVGDPNGEDDEEQTCSEQTAAHVVGVTEINSLAEDREDMEVLKYASLSFCSAIDR
jgi:hypothetical protein